MPQQIVIAEQLRIAAVLTDEPFGLREWAGVILISLAGLAEVLLPRARAFFQMR